MFVTIQSFSRISISLSLVLLAGSAHAQWVQDAKLVPADAIAGVEVGASVAISGATAVIGAPHDSQYGPSAGAAYVYTRDESGWVQPIKLSASNAGAFDEFGAAIALDGDVLVVGAPLEDGRGNGAGAAYVFRNIAGIWVEQVKLLASDGGSFDQFGSSVSVSGDWIVVGSASDDDRGRNAGAAYVYNYDGTSWNEQVKLTAPDGLAGDFFGTSVAVDNDVILVGAPRADAAGNNAGAAYAFGWDGSAWSFEGKMLADDAGVDDRFGGSVSIRGGYALLGALRHDSAGPNAGAAYIFAYQAGAWNQSAKLVGDDVSSADFFGAAVALTDHCAVVSAHFDDGAGVNAGAVYVFRESSGNWSQEAVLSADDGALFDKLGIAVAVDGEQVFAGAVGQDTAGDNAGAVYAFMFEQTGNPPSCDAGGPYSVDCRAGGVSIELDGSGSFDPDNDDLRFHWASDCADAAFDDPNSPNPILTLSGSAGCENRCTVTLTLSDGQSEPVSCEAAIIVSDNHAPAITCPEDVELDPAQDSEPDATGWPSVEDCDPNVALNYDDELLAADCASDDVGVTIVRTWTATDSCGHQSSCEQMIFVRRVVLPLAIKPGACPVVHNPRSRGKLPVALLGTDDFDVSSIDIASLRLMRADCQGGAVAPENGPPGPKPKFDDVATPASDEPCACHVDEPDGLDDLILKFSSEDLEEQLHLSQVEHDEVELVLVGTINDPKSDLDGNEFIARACLRLTGGKGGDDSDRNDRDDDVLLPSSGQLCGAGGGLVFPLTLLSLAVMRTTGPTRLRRRRSASRDE